MSVLSLLTSAFNIVVLHTRQRHHPAAATAMIWGPQTVWRTKYRTEKTKRLKTRSYRYTPLLESNFWVQTLPRRTIFLACQLLPLENFFLLGFPTSPLLINRAFRRHRKKSNSSLRSIQKSKNFWSRKRKKRQNLKCVTFYLIFSAILQNIALAITV